MSIFLSLTYKNPDGKEAVKIEKDYKAAMKDFLRYSSYRDAKILFINTAIEVMTELQSAGSAMADDGRNRH
ncbi:MAG: hypothetical protein ABSG94_12190 [Brevinematales bacterium]|jgi:hypothetical protein